MQTYLRAAELAALHRVAKAKKRCVADLVREAIREKYLRPAASGPVALCALGAEKRRIGEARAIPDDRIAPVSAKNTRS